MNEQIRAHYETVNENKPSANVRQMLRFVSDITDAGIEIENPGLDSLYNSAVYAALAQMFGETSPRVLNGHNPCMIPEYIDYRMTVMAETK